LGAEGIDVRAGRLARYAVAATLARSADEMVSLSVVLLVIGRTGSFALSGAAVAGYTLPAVLTGPFLGDWLSHARRPVIALAANELVLAAVAVALVITVGHVPAPVIVVLTALAGASLPLTSAGYSSLLPAMVGRAGLARANTVDALSVNGPAIGGPALAGTLAAVAGPGSAMLGIGAVALLAAAVTLRLKVTKPGETARPALLSTARAGLAHLARTGPLRAATLASVISYGCVGLLVVALPALMTHLGARSTSAGYLWTAFEVGGVASILLLSPRLRTVRPERVIVTAVAGYGLLLAVMATMTNLTATIAVAVLAGAAEGPNLPAVFAARQRYSPDTLLAQVSTTGASLKIGAFAIGSVLSGALTGGVGPAGTVLGAAAGQAAAAVVGLTTSGRVPRTP
jgi:MFS family permease